MALRQSVKATAFPSGDHDSDEPSQTLSEPNVSCVEVRRSRSKRKRRSGGGELRATIGSVVKTKLLRNRSAPARAGSASRAVYTMARPSGRQEKSSTSVPECVTA